MTTMLARSVAITGAAALLLGGLTAEPVAADQPSYMVIASGLNNPRHLSIGPGGVLYVAESGVGGRGPCLHSSDGGTLVCYGATGSIAEIIPGPSGWTQHEVVTGLPSLAPPKTQSPRVSDPPTFVRGGSATGPSDVEVTGHRYVASIGLGAAPSSRDSGAATTQGGQEDETLPAGFGDLITGTVRPGHTCKASGVPAPGRCPVGDWSTMADVAGYEAEHNPVVEEGTVDPDSNPASVARQGSHYLVADAGGNTVLSVDRRGNVSLIAAFQNEAVMNPPDLCDTTPPSCPPVMQAVPTSIVRGPGGAYYVSQLTGFPFPVGGSTIWRIVPAHGHHTATVTPYVTGLTNVTDLAFAPDGSLYATEISTGGLAASGPIGALVRIPPGGGAASPVVAPLFAPYGLALDDSYAYVTTGGTLPGWGINPLTGATGGQVIQIPLGG